MSFTVRLRRNQAQPTSTTSVVTVEAPSLAPGASIDAFQTVYATYRNDVLRYCRYRLPSEEDAEDATQDIFLHVFDALPRWQPQGGGMRPWIFSIAHNEIVSRYRATARHPQIGIAAAGELPDLRRSPEQHAVDRDAATRVLRLLDQLPEEQRRVMELRLVGLTGVEIATVLGKRHAAVRKVQERAVRRLTELRLADPTLGGGEPA